MADIGKVMLDQYKPPEVTIDCGRCRRHLTVSVVTLRKKFGNQRLDVIARMVARVGSSIYGPCALADDPFAPLCSARASEPDPVSWATLNDAERGGWMATLHCERHHSGLKRAKSCPETIDLPIRVLMAVFGYDFPLDRLPRKIRCGYCGTPSVTVEWRIPAEAPPPGGTTEAQPAPLQLRPTPAQIGRKRFRVVENDKLIRRRS